MRHQNNFNAISIRWQKEEGGHCTMRHQRVILFVPANSLNACRPNKMEEMNMTIRDWKIDTKATIGERFIVTDVRKKVEYSEGVKTDKIMGYRYYCVCPDRRYVAVSVTVLGARMVDDEAVANNVMLRFSGLEGKPYLNDMGVPMLTWTAESVAVIKG